MATPETKVISNPSRNANRERIEREERELEELMKAELGSEEEEEENTEEETQEETDEAGKQTEPAKEENKEQEEDELSAEEKTYKKRYGDLRRHFQKKLEEKEQEIASIKEQTEKEGFLPPKSDEDLKAWAAKYPDIASIVETIATNKARELFNKSQEKFESLEQLHQEAKRAEAESEIRKIHPDFDTLRNQDKFHNWVEKQPESIQSILYDNEDDAASVIKVIHLYKVENGLTKTDKAAEKKKAALDVSSKSKKPELDADGDSKKLRESEVLRWSDAEFEKNQDKIVEAQRSGNFIYDISKK